MRVSFCCLKTLAKNHLAPERGFAVQPRDMCVIRKILTASAMSILVFNAAQAEIDLDLGGYFRGYVGYAKQDINGIRESDFKRKSKIFFEGSNTFDHNLTIGLFTELFMENGDDNISASYLYGEGDWGHVKFGDERGAPFQLQVAAPGSDTNIDGRDIHISFLNVDGTDVDQD